MLQKEREMPGDNDIQAIEQEFYDGSVKGAKSRMLAFDEHRERLKDLHWSNDLLYFAARDLKARKANA